jgi:hypothetical protein
MYKSLLINTAYDNTVGYGDRGACCCRLLCCSAALKNVKFNHSRADFPVFVLCQHAERALRGRSIEISGSTVTCGTSSSGASPHCTASER